MKSNKTFILTCQAERCGKQFESKRQKVKWCSHACSVWDYKRRMRTSPPPKKKTKVIDMNSDKIFDHKDFKTATI